jgi:hypothetical protein
MQNDNGILKDLQSNYKASLSSKNRVDSNIQKWLKAYNGQPYGNEVKGRSSIVVKDVKKAIKKMSPSIIEPFISTDTLVRCKGTTVGAENQASYTSDILNYQYNNEFDKLEFITSISTILPKEGTVFVRTGWDFKEDVKKKRVTGITQEEFAMLQSMSSSVEKVEPNNDGTVDATFVSRKRVSNKPTAKICKNEAITTDPTAESFKESKFITYEYEKSYSDIKKESNIYDYQEITLALLESLSTSPYPETALGGQRAMDNYQSGVDYNFRFTDNASKKIRIIEYWGEYDINGDGINEQIVCAWVKGTDIILRLDENPYPDNAIPFVSCQFNFEPFTLWGNGLADIIGDHQQIHTAIMRGFIDNMSLANNGQKFFQKGAIDYVNLGKLSRGEKYIELNNLNGMTDGSYNQIPSAAFQVYDMISSDSDMHAGVSNNMDGIDSATIGRTASGVNMVMSAAQRHMMIIVKVISDMFKDIFSKWAAYNAAFLDHDQAVEIAGEVVQINKADLLDSVRIEMNVNVDAMNTQKISQLNMLLQQAGQLQGNIPPMVVPMLVAEFFEGLGKYEAAEEIRQYQPQPDPMQQQMQQLEMQKLQLENQLLQAQAQLALSKANEANSGASLKESQVDHTDMKTLSIPNQDNLKEAEFKHGAIQDFLKDTGVEK